ncbi:MAG: hypothetical protein RL885_22975 [Planctomycetota bacterium]
MKRDVFPKTQRTWIDEQLEGGEGGRSSVNRHIMHVYASCLRVWFLGSSYRGKGDAEDVIRGFFADRLAREDFLDRWRASDKRLRHWLINAFHFYLKEQRRASHRQKRWHALPEEIESSSEPPARVIDRAFAESLVQEASEKVLNVCRSKGQESYWKIFLEHHVERIPYRDLGARFGVSAEKAAVMARTAERRFIRTLREFVGRDGTKADEIDREIQALLESIGE